ncbi:MULTISPECIES: hypothetical protein [Bacillus]|uniref:Uncharacterized protein n=1 Tax=Bacillus pseudomycoides TaxID=64104 RepID=A0AAJ2DMR3_9BACI|nr:hypothetical protein [Bacillus pseudomycoides]KFN15147.1 hypothetical protein DJ94_819 [Bacillus pseudomycoides]MBD5798672.1 hypothetical protein [Bacillus pseudomycoides]MCR8859449.1 hypothetical protein [Bacillus pseudomycoides]MDR4188449.1 hypothetical protein [Bacillus pseudomycoides]MDR4329410.1 hypothetical protein [Bacillus pseudomycoides]
MTEEKQQRLLEWWEATEQGTVVVKRLVSYITELRLHPESSRADGMILFYRAASEISYGYAGMRGCIRRAFTPEYSEFLRNNIVRCHSFTRKFSVDTKILLERVAKEITGANAMQIVDRIRETLRENDAMLREIQNKADAFFGKKNFQTSLMQSITMLTTQ